MFKFAFGDTSLQQQIEALGLAGAYAENLNKATVFAKNFAGNGLLPCLTQAAGGPDTAGIEKLAAHITSGFSNLVILGTGGSSLGAQAATALAAYTKGLGTKIYTPDSLDPFLMDHLFASLDPLETHILAISKSGTTGETLAQLLACRQWLENAGTQKPMKDHFSFITEPGKRALRTYGDDLGSLILDHPTDVGGRFSVLTNVGMVPVAVAGLSVKDFRNGAKAVCDAFSADPAMSAAVVGAALIQTLNENLGVTQVLIMPYAESLRAFTRWHGQLWAESLGKNGLGTTPIRAVGPVDQHSQMQLFLDGPNDKFCTIVTVPSYGKGPRIDVAAAEKYGLTYMAGRTIGDMVTCQSRATQDTLRAKGRLVREIVIDSLSEENLGGLFASFMLETVITAHLMGVDAYDQPAVEEGKILTRKYLGEL
ncbi:glucose-6-phosphate isomerase [Kordiimonas pumila]|uniref:Glucose-6-phosphate isomerase n=1 Tax=Kordiimonas pumila TaxID=2161677 RepID=A0ABV7D3J5_9PROT|nr:glucose-6-phosphate isomerase [Kordiimonas pumila]